MTVSPPQRLNRDVVVVGAGFYGLSVALALSAQGRSVTVIEREPDVLLRASSRNQARVHGGYHYPRSLRTAQRSQANYPRFLDDHREAVREMRSIYAIARLGSHVNGRQFARFCELVGAPVRPVDPAAERLFDLSMIDGAYVVREAAFDATRLAEALKAKLMAAGVELSTGTEAVQVSTSLGDLEVLTRGADGPVTFLARDVIVCAYAGTAELASRSGLDPLPLRYQHAEIALVELPAAFDRVAITVMDGPFFSVVPHPPTPGLHTLSHVRFTPRRDHRNSAPGIDAQAEPGGSAFPYMVKDAGRFIPSLMDARFVESIRETKVFPAASDPGDGRPILVHRPPEIDRLVFIVGGKLDNVYDVVDEVAPRQASVR